MLVVAGFVPTFGDASGREWIKKGLGKKGEGIVTVRWCTAHIMEPMCHGNKAIWVTVG